MKAPCSPGTRTLTVRPMPPLPPAEEFNSSAQEKRPATLTSGDHPTKRPSSCRPALQGSPFANRPLPLPYAEQALSFSLPHSLIETHIRNPHRDRHSGEEKRSLRQCREQEKTSKQNETKQKLLSGRQVTGILKQEHLHTIEKHSWK